MRHAVDVTTVYHMTFGQLLFGQENLKILFVQLRDNEAELRRALSGGVRPPPSHTRLHALMWANYSAIRLTLCGSYLPLTFVFSATYSRISSAENCWTYSSFLSICFKMPRPPRHEGVSRFLFGSSLRWSSSVRNLHRRRLFSPFLYLFVKYWLSVPALHGQSYHFL